MAGRRLREMSLLRKLLREHGDIPYSEGLRLLAPRKVGRPRRSDDWVHRFVFLTVELFKSCPMRQVAAQRAAADYLGTTMPKVEKAYRHGRLIMGDDYPKFRDQILAGHLSTFEPSSRFIEKLRDERRRNPPE